MGHDRSPRRKTAPGGPQWHSGRQHGGQTRRWERAQRRAHDETMTAPEQQPRFANALSTDPAIEVAQQRCAAALAEGLGGRRPDFLVLFVSPHYGDDLHRITSMLLGDV